VEGFLLVEGFFHFQQVVGVDNEAYGGQGEDILTLTFGVKYVKQEFALFKPQVGIKLCGFGNEAFEVVIVLNESGDFVSALVPLYVHLKADVEQRYQQKQYKYDGVLFPSADLFFSLLHLWACSK